MNVGELYDFELIILTEAQLRALCGQRARKSKHEQQSEKVIETEREAS
jgi:hypothetical protein